MEYYAISDIHFKSIGYKSFNHLINAIRPNSTLIVVGDSDYLGPLEDLSNDKRLSLALGYGNTDPISIQDRVNILADDQVTILCYKGVNWNEAPWAKYHLRDQPSSVTELQHFLENVRADLSRVTTPKVILAIHFPLMFVSQDGLNTYCKDFLDLVTQDSRICYILHGHVHNGFGEIPTTCAHAKVLNVSADRLGYIPVKLDLCLEKVVQTTK